VEVSGLPSGWFDRQHWLSPLGLTSRHSRATITPLAIFAVSL
jgi:hypothetical protein